MSEEKQNLKKTGGKKKIMFVYGLIQLGSSLVSAIALSAIAFGLIPLNKESQNNNRCVSQAKEMGSSNAEAVRFCNGGN